MRSIFPTEVPPNFCTTMFIYLIPRLCSTEKKFGKLVEIIDESSTSTPFSKANPIIKNDIAIR
jgi:hypothetical protein